ncbi:MAG: glycoside hydrolase family 5 [Rariglobus sp.]|jgi:hypothetical protein|nr:glycoside hydrolase family 5 [Rariglobus sp.]
MLRFRLSLLLLATALPGFVSAQTPPSLVENSAMETDVNGDGWPDGWARPSSGGTWESENGNRYIRLTSPHTGGSVMLHNEIRLPEGAASIELRWRQRISNLVTGSQPGLDARIPMEFLDSSQASLTPDLRFPSYRQNSAGWEPKFARLPVPANARAFTFTPTLLRVKSGVYDLDDVVISAASAPAAPAAAIPPSSAPASMPPEPAAAAPEPPLAPGVGAPPELRVQGNRLVTVKGGKEVWLQGVNVPSLEWSVKGERILKSVGIAIDEWKANVIRLPVKAEHWFGKGTKHNVQNDGGAAYRDLIDQAVALAASKGAYLVLDLHHYRAPRPEYLEFWTDAATRYKNHPAVLFDLLNEPHGTTWEIWRDGGFLEEKKKDGDEDTFLTPEEKLHNKRGYVSPGMQKMLDTVRATGAKNIVVIGGLDYAYDLSGIVNGFALTDKSGNGIMYASHVYPWKKGWQKKLLDAAARHPILLGEVGGDAKKMAFIPANHQENVETWVPAMLGLIQKHRLNWTGWCFHPSASPRMLSDLNYTPTPFWGQPAKDALSGKKFPEPAKLR